MDMQFNVAQLMKEPVGARRDYDFGTPEMSLSEPLESDEGALVAQDVAGHIRFTRLRGQLRANGHAQARVALECSRCLDSFSATVDAPLEELFRQTIDVTSGAPLADEPVDDEDEVFAIDANHIVDLTEPVRQALLVALPMRPLCKEDCRGLCPTCGTNWNVAQCDCAPDELDPRLSALSRLLGDLDTSDSPA